MYRVTTHTRRFEMSSNDDLADYSEIVNNPLKTVVEERKFTETEKDFDDGKLAGVRSTEYMVVTWQEKIPY